MAILRLAAERFGNEDWFVTKDTSMRACSIDVEDLFEIEPDLMGATFVISTKKPRGNDNDYHKFNAYGRIGDKVYTLSQDDLSDEYHTRLTGGTSNRIYNLLRKAGADAKEANTIYVWVY